MNKLSIAFAVSLFALSSTARALDQVAPTQPVVAKPACGGELEPWFNGLIRPPARAVSMFWGARSRPQDAAHQIGTRSRASVVVRRPALFGRPRPCARLPAATSRLLRPPQAGLKGDLASPLDIVRCRHRVVALEPEALAVLRWL